jgi:hypothetical protein
VIWQETHLAQCALKGDRSAFDELFERFFARVAWHHRHQSRRRREAAIAEALRRVFLEIELRDWSELVECALGPCGSGERPH